MHTDCDVTPTNRIRPVAASARLRWLCVAFYVYRVGQDQMLGGRFSFEIKLWKHVENHVKQLNYHKVGYLQFINVSFLINW